ncbi:MAG: hypothetical protein IKU43_03215 [Clostridia bacterium]|nr:hypothetical protein [Clostridia bacterium]
MYKFRTTFFQALLIILALAFTLAVRYAECTRTVSAGTFGSTDVNGGVTVSDILGVVAERAGK